MLPRCSDPAAPPSSLPPLHFPQCPLKPSQHSPTACSHPIRKVDCLQSYVQI